MDKIFLLDAGHGGVIDGVYQTAGKRSPVWPDGTQYFEGEGNRLIRDEIIKIMKEEGLRYKIISEGRKDTSLRERVRAANALAKKYGVSNCVYVSIHSNGATASAEGWEVFTSKGQTDSDKYATIIYDEMKKLFPGSKFRSDKWSDGDVDKESGFTVLSDTICPSILTENFFHTNKNECKSILMNRQGRKLIALGHVNAFKVINSL